MTAVRQFEMFCSHTETTNINMRTKTLLLTAALSAAGVATSLAQTYSQNIVGYINLGIPAGFSMIANQLNNSPDNKVTTLFGTNAPIGTAVYKYSPAGFAELDYDGTWSGDDVDMTMNPGEGVFINPPKSFSITFVGEVQLSSSIPVPAGFAIRSSALPLSAKLQTDLKYPPGNGDAIYQFHSSTQSYTEQDYAGGWDGDLGTGVEPTPAIGESFWILNANAAKVWTQTFTVGG